jgi:hypothetical protein
MDNSQQPQQPHHSQEPQPPTQPQYVQPQPYPPVTREDPGKTLGIVGFVFAFVGLALIGLILSIIGYSKSKKAGFNNSLALAGIILNAVFTVVFGFVIGLFILGSISYGGLNTRANDVNSKSTAATVIKWSEVYSADKGSYPTTLSQLHEETGAGNATNITFSDNALVFEPTNPATVVFYSCGQDGNKVGYWSYSVQSMQFMYTGNVNESSNCTIAGR